MHIVRDKNDLDPHKKVYQCFICNESFNWNKGSSWYGSMRQMDEDPNSVKCFCSEKCLMNCKPEKIKNF